MYIYGLAAQMGVLWFVPMAFLFIPKWISIKFSISLNLKINFSAIIANSISLWAIKIEIKSWHIAQPRVADIGNVLGQETATLEAGWGTGEEGE